MNDNEKFLKENIVFAIIPILVIVGFAYMIFQISTTAWDNRGALKDKQATKTTQEEKLADLKLRLAKQKKQEEMEEKAKKEKKSGSGKVIYEVLGQQFSPEASFGIMFENLLSNITKSGVRIRSIDYNYHPQNDTILDTAAPGYNACELSFTTVGSYSQLQKFFKNIAKETYLTSLYEVYIEPYDKDKTILIAKFKVRLYTKIVDG